MQSCRFSRDYSHRAYHVKVSGSNRGLNSLTYLDPELSFSFARTSSMLKLAAF